MVVSRNWHRRVVIELWVFAILLSVFTFAMGYGLGAVIEWHACKQAAEQRELDRPLFNESVAEAR